MITITQIKDRLIDVYPTLTGRIQIKYAFQSGLSLMVYILAA